MKRFPIGIIGISVELYIGEEGKAKYSKKLKSMGYDGELSFGVGQCYGSVVWVYDKKDVAVLLHEMSHAMDSIMEYIGSDDTEFRAYLFEDLMMRVLLFAGVLKDEFRHGTYKTIKREK